MKHTKLSLLVVASLVAACDPTPLPEEDRELVEQFLDLASCVAAENDVVTDLPASGGLPAYRGEVRPPAAIECGRNLNETGRIHSLTTGSQEACAPGADGCVQPDFGGCADRMWLRDTAIPESMLDYGPQGGPVRGRGHPLFFGMLIYHESIHTVQSDRYYRNCPSAMEVEAYDQEARFHAWLTLSAGLGPEGQLRKIVTTPGSGVEGGPVPFTPPSCQTINAAIADGLSSCMVAFMETHFPEVGFDDALSNEDCLAIDRLLRNVTANSVTRRADEREASASCLATAGMSMGLTERSDDFNVVTTADVGGVIYQYALDGAGEFTLVHSFSTGFDSVADIALLRDASGTELLVIAGIKAGTPTLAVREDSLGGEFGTPADGILDGTASEFSDSRLQSPTQIVDGGAHPAMLWDRDSQMALRIETDGSGIPTGLSAAINLRVPVGLYGSTLEHHPTLAEAYVTGDRARASDATVYRFAVTQGSVYTPVEALDVREAAIYPPGFLAPPTAGSTQVRVDGRRGDTVEVQRMDDAGTHLATLGSAVVGAAGEVVIGVSPSLSTGDFVRAVSTTSGTEGRTIPVLAVQRPRAHHVSPAYGSTAGGTRLRLRGSGFNQVVDVTFDGISATSFTVVDDETMLVVTPAAAEGSALLHAETTTGTFILGSHRYESPSSGFLVRYDGTALAAAWSASGTGWYCGSSVQGTEPSSGDLSGCRFEGVAGTWGALTSPAITLPLQGPPLELLIHHQGDFGSDGDGVVVLASDGVQVHTLVPRARTTTRIHASVCSGSGAARTCLADPQVAGQRGYGGAAVPRLWRTDVFELPPEFAGSGGIALLIGATDISGVDSADYGVSWVEIRDANRLVGDESGWNTLVNAGNSCSGIHTGGYFSCGPYGAGTAFRYHSAPLSSSTGYVHIPVALDSLAGRQVSVRMRHGVGFSPGHSVGTGAGRLRVLCSSMSGIVTPIGGYPATPPGVAPAFTDEGPDHYYWGMDEFDISAFAGQSGCRLDLLGYGEADPSQIGWIVDSVVVRWR